MSGLTRTRDAPSTTGPDTSRPDEPPREPPSVANTWPAPPSAREPVQAAPAPPLPTVTTPLEIAATRRWYRRPIVWIVAVLALFGTFVVLVAARGGSSNADPSPGVYTGSGDDGFVIKFTVDADGGGINDLTSEVRCGSLGRSQTMSFESSLEIENGEFTLPEPSTGGIGVEGRFVGDGTRANGDWTTGSCSGNWSAEHAAPAPAAAPGTEVPSEEAGDAPAAAPVEEAQADKAPSTPATGDTLTFVPADAAWATPEPGVYRATGDADTFAWSEETVEGDLVLQLDVTSDFTSYGEGMVIVYGDGSDFSQGSLIFNITGYWQAIRAHSIYDEGGAEWLVENPDRLDLGVDGQRDTFTMKVEVSDDMARLVVDGAEVARVQLPDDIRRSGRVGLVKYGGSADVTFSNIRFEGTLGALEEVAAEAPATTADTTPKTIPATEPSIVIGDYEFAIVGTGFDSTLLGMEPADVTFDHRILFVEFDLLAGDQAAFEQLEIVATEGAGFEAMPLALMADGRVEMLSTLTVVATSGEYQPDPGSVAWAWAVPTGSTDLQLVFPTGEIVDLQPVLTGEVAEEVDAVEETTTGELEQAFVESFYTGMPDSMRVVIPEDEVHCAVVLASERLTLADIDEMASDTPSPEALDRIVPVLDECFSTDTAHDLFAVALVEGGFSETEAACMADGMGPITMGDFLRFGTGTELPDEFVLRITDALQACGLM